MLALPEEAQNVIDIMERPRTEKTEAEVHSVLHLMHKYNSIRYAQDCSKKLLKEAAEKFNQNLAHLARQ